MNNTGLIVIDKPSGLTSRDVVNHLQKRFPRRTKIGHAGTLDPLATGVLVVAVGQATRFIEYVQDLPKVYRTQIVFGATSTTDDADGTITPAPNAMPVSEEQLRAALPSFLGEIAQVPPAFSAAHVDGQRAYTLARRGDEVALAPRTVRIDRLEVRSYAWPQLELDVFCGKGTYIRSIARDLGTLLHVGGYVQTLRRLAIGTFVVEEATSLEAEPVLLPLTRALAGWPTFVVDAAAAHRLRLGQFLPTRQPAGPFVALDEASNVVAVGQVVKGLFKPEKVVPVE